MQTPEPLDNTSAEPLDEAVKARREFLKSCGRFAAVTPPAMAMMLAVTTTPAHAKPSSFPGKGWGVGGNPETKEPGKHPTKKW